MCGLHECSKPQGFKYSQARRLRGFRDSELLQIECWDCGSSEAAAPDWLKVEVQGGSGLSSGGCPSRGSWGSSPSPVAGGVGGFLGRDWGDSGRWEFQLKHGSSGF